MISKVVKLLGATSIALTLAACEEYPIIDYDDKMASQSEFRSETDAAGRYVPTSLPGRSDPIIRRYETTIYFEPGESRLDREDMEKIDEIIDAAELMDGNYYLTIIGHSDDDGSEDRKSDIAEKRAYAAFMHMDKGSIRNANVILKSVSDREPAVLGNSDYSDNMNRRVQIILEPKRR